MGPWSMSLYAVIKCVVPNVQHLTDCSTSQSRSKFLPQRLPLSECP